jgi:hypothetical protein
LRWRFPANRRLISRMSRGRFQRPSCSPAMMNIAKLPNLLQTT